MNAQSCHRVRPGFLLVVTNGCGCSCLLCQLRKVPVPETLRPAGSLISSAQCKLPSTHRRLSPPPVGLHGCLQPQVLQEYLHSVELPSQHHGPESREGLQVRSGLQRISGRFFGGALLCHLGSRQNGHGIDSSPTLPCTA